MARILVVDDDPDILHLVPDLVLADWAMPRLSGIELLARMRADTVTAGIPFILLTARAQQIDEPGIDGFVAKPFSLTELTDRVDEVLARSA